MPQLARRELPGAQLPFSPAWHSIVRVIPGTRVAVPAAGRRARASLPDVAIGALAALPGCASVIAGRGRGSVAGHGRLIQRPHGPAKPGRIGDRRGVAALLVTADHADDRAQAGGPLHAGQERPAAGPVRVPAAVELHLMRAEGPGP